MSVGAITQAHFTNYDELLHGKFSGSAIALIVIGFLILIISSFGCCGAIKENRCLLQTYGALLLCIFVAEMAIGIWTLTSPDAGDEILTQDHMYKYFKEEYSGKHAGNSSYDVLQAKLECCGVKGPTDFLTSGLTVPRSCCSEKAISCTQFTAYKTGCFDSLTKLINQSIIIGIVAILVACIEVLAIVFAFCLAGHYRNY